MQKIQYDQGGYLNWTNADWVDGLSKKVQGLKPSAAGVLGNYRFLDAWLAADAVSSTVAAPVARSREGSPLLRFVGRRTAGRRGGPVRRLARDLRRHAAAAGRRRERRAGPQRQPGHRQGAESAAATSIAPPTSSTSTGSRASSTAISATRRSGMAQGATSAPIWPLISDAVVNSVILAADHGAAHDPALTRPRRGRGRVCAESWPDHLISVASLAAIALPEFVIGSLLIGVFFVGLDWLPPVAIVAPGASPLDDPEKLVLPVATLLLASLAAGIRMVRAGMVEVLQTEYVQTARLNGVSEQPRAVALRAAQRAADERADPGAEPAVADRRDHHHRERLRVSGHRLDARRRRPEPRPHARACPCRC